ncbi:MAG TPA: 6-bladed beta-propeller [Gemmatimonadaceae bacterium]|nr:6-bladed beta-propeller [Gemmatimonadaceae bacterium]
MTLHWGTTSRELGGGMPRLVGAALLVAATVVLPASGEPSAAPFPIRVIHTDTIARDLSLVVIIDATLGVDGSAYVIDYSNNRILHFRPDGTLAWRVGRQGRGPGEYLGAYRVAAYRDQRVLVHDVMTQEVTLLDSSGRYLDRKMLPVHFDAVDRMVALPNGGKGSTSRKTPLPFAREWWTAVQRDPSAAPTCRSNGRWA